MKKKFLEANINGKTIIGKTNKELVYNCLQELYNQYKEMPAEKRIKEYVNYCVDNFSYDWNLAKETLSADREETHELNEEELTRLFIKKTGVCNQFAKVLSLISCFDKDIDIHYCHCSVLPANEEKTVGHAVNLVIMNSKASIIDISSMIHSKEKHYKQDKKCFNGVDFQTYIETLKNENVEYQHILNDKYVLGSLKYFKDFDNNYFLLQLLSDEINTNNLTYDIWKIPINKENNINL